MGNTRGKYQGYGFGCTVPVRQNENKKFGYRYKCRVQNSNVPGADRVVQNSQKSRVHASKKAKIKLTGQKTQLSTRFQSLRLSYCIDPVAPVAYQVILEPGIIGRFREFKFPRFHILV